jgi:predicted  nucleic acid-binding Zn-ribbon protein
MSNGKSVMSRKWEEAIEDAKKHVQRLQATIRTLEEKKAKGEKWPGTSSRARRASG